MESISYKLDVFEGPMDLLLHLISKHKIDINDIPILLLVEQYLDFVLENADEVFVMEHGEIRFKGTRNEDDHALAEQRPRL